MASLALRETRADIEWGASRPRVSYAYKQKNTLRRE
jgi:hypothetical protein